MPWNTIAVEDVQAEFNATEISTLAGAGGSLDKILANVVQDVRGRIVASGGLVDKTPGTIPDQLRMDVIALARWRYIGSAPMLQDLKSKEREELYNRAIETLDLISRGRVAIERPDADSIAAAGEAPVNAVQTVHSLTRRATRCKMNGLL